MVEKTGQETKDTNLEQRAVRDKTVEDYSVRTREVRKKKQCREEQGKVGKGSTLQDIFVPL